MASTLVLQLIDVTLCIDVAVCIDVASGRYAIIVDVAVCIEVASGRYAVIVDVASGCYALIKDVFCLFRRHCWANAF